MALQPLEEKILRYAYIMKRKYEVDSVSLARFCYKMQRHIKAMKPAVDILVARNLLQPMKVVLLYPRRASTISNTRES